jgi:hypothetical protein
MNAQEMLEKGIKYEDWDMIKEAKAQLAAEGGGATIMLPNSSENPPSHLTQPEQEPILKEVPTPGGQGHDFSFQIRKNGDAGRRTTQDGGAIMRSEPINTNRVGSFNLFEDDLSEGRKDLKHLQKERSDGKSLYINSPTVGKLRAGARLVDAECIGCGKHFEVAPIHARKVEGEVRFKCDTCVRRRGRGEGTIPQM